MNTVLRWRSAVCNNSSAVGVYFVRVAASCRLPRIPENITEILRWVVVHRWQRRRRSAASHSQFTAGQTRLPLTRLILSCGYLRQRVCRFISVSWLVSYCDWLNVCLFVCYLVGLKKTEQKWLIFTKLSWKVAHCRGRRFNGWRLIRFNVGVLLALQLNRIMSSNLQIHPAAVARARHISKLLCMGHVCYAVWWIVTILRYQRPWHGIGARESRSSVDNTSFVVLVLCVLFCCVVCDCSSARSLAHWLCVHSASGGLIMLHS